MVKFDETHRMNIFDSDADLYDCKKLSYEVIEQHRVRIDVDKASRTNSCLGSSGNQRKWHDRQNRFVKLNNLGYEDLAEICSCWLFKQIQNLEFNFVYYYPCKIYESGLLVGNGVVSDDFVGGCEEITIRDVLQDTLESFSIDYDSLVDLIDNNYGYDIRSYLDAKACLDAMTRNEDSHWGNFVLLLSDNSTVSTPIFDYGDSCMSDCVSYPIGCDFDKAFSNITSKPFCSDFERQINPFCKRMLLNFTNFKNSVELASDSEEYNRAVKTMLKALEVSKGIAWEDV